MDICNLIFKPQWIISIGYEPQNGSPINQAKDGFEAGFPDPPEADAIIPLRKLLDTPDCLDHLEEADLI